MNNKLSLKIALAHALTFAAASSFAYLPNMQDSHYGWYSALAATWMKPSDINYDDTAKATYQTGVNALLGYLLADRYDVNADYTYNWFSNPNVKDKYHVLYNAGTLSLGHYIKARRWYTHVYGGLDYTYIQENTITSPPIDNPKITFNGVGPQLGFETSFKLFKPGSRADEQFKLVGGANLAVLASNVSVGGIGTFNTALKTQAKLGLIYERIIKNERHVSFELGYKTVLVQNITSSDFTGHAFGHIDASDGYAFAMNGPYLSIGATC